MTRRWAIPVAGCGAALLVPRTALAGMPSWVLSDFAKLRLEAISFFVVCLLASALAVKWLWNYLARDFSRLPKMTCGKAVGAVVLWGLLFVVVLTMISGARELMTPGAWIKEGATYRLRSDEAGSEPSFAEEITARQRREHLQHLRAALWNYAGEHDGSLPPDRDDPAVEPQRWQVPGMYGMRYLYVPGVKIKEQERMLAIEPNVFRDGQFVLTTTGTIRLAANDEIERALATTKVSGASQ